MEALVTALQCAQSLSSKPCGMTAVLQVRGFVRAVAELLRPVGDSDCTRLVLELLTKMLLFTDQSYRKASWKKLVGWLICQAGWTIPYRELGSCTHYPWMYRSVQSANPASKLDKWWER